MNDTTPWYCSTTIWSGIITIVSLCLGMWGYSLTADDQQTLVGIVTTIGTAVGGIGTIVGRVRATKQIKTPGT